MRDRKRDNPVTDTSPVTRPGYLDPGGCDKRDSGGEKEAKKPESIPFDAYDETTLAKLMRESAYQSNRAYQRTWGTQMGTPARAAVHMDFVDKVYHEATQQADTFTVRDLSGHDQPEHIIQKYRRAILNLEADGLLKRQRREGLEVHWAVAAVDVLERASAGRVQHAGGR